MSWYEKFVELVLQYAVLHVYTRGVISSSQQTEGVSRRLAQQDLLYTLSTVTKNMFSYL